MFRFATANPDHIHVMKACSSKYVIKACRSKSKHHNICSKVGTFYYYFFIILLLLILATMNNIFSTYKYVILVIHIYDYYIISVYLV